jgi:WD40 repeat protein
MIAIKQLQGQINIFNIKNGNFIQSLFKCNYVDHNYLESIAFSQNGDLLAHGFFNTINIWKILDGTLIRTITGTFECVDFLAFSANDELLISGSGNNLINIWSVSNGTLIRTITNLFNGYANDLYNNYSNISSDGKFIALITNDYQHIEIWNILELSRVYSFKIDSDDIFNITFSIDNKLLAIRHRITIELRKLDGTLERTINAHLYYINSIIFSPNNEFLASYGDKVIKIWKTSDGTLIQTLNDEFDEMQMSFINNKYLVSISGEKFKIWKISDGTIIHTFFISCYINKKNYCIANQSYLQNKINELQNEIITLQNEIDEKKKFLNDEIFFDNE